ncbi:hypothetical protein [Variovorax sp. PvP013]|uniref:hypothetical protein n=1 Tax=Variovorax sp. PvP013 TaxID=3156435 RepID=UPI003D25E674
MTRFVSACQQLAKQLELKPKNTKEAAHMDIGRAWAVQLIDALRSGDETPSLLAAGVMLSGKNQAPEVMAGFIDELSEAIKDGIR